MGSRIQSAIFRAAQSRAQLRFFSATPKRSVSPWQSIKAGATRLSVERPFLWNVGTSGLMYVVGDALCQWLETSVFHDRDTDIGLDWQRLTRMLLYGALVCGPLCHVWYAKVLDTARFTAWLTRMVGVSKSRQAAAKVVADEGVFAPIATVAFYYGMTRLEFKSHDAGVERAQDKFWPTLKVDWCFWSLVQFANFMLIPPNFRVVVIQSVSVLWNGFLSWMQHSDAAPEVLHTPDIVDHGH
ncbi:MAG: hypothetical protein MHM6MM_005807 [Cercozoa sp. M6MM]